MSLIGSIIFPNIKAKQRIKTFTKLIIWRLREYKFSRFNKSQTFKFSDISKYCDQEKILTIRWWESSSNPSVTAGQSSWPSVSSSTSSSLSAVPLSWKDQKLVMPNFLNGMGQVILLYHLNFGQTNQMGCYYTVITVVVST